MRPLPLWLPGFGCGLVLRDGPCRLFCARNWEASESAASVQLLCRDCLREPVITARSVQSLHSPPAPDMLRKAVNQLRRHIIIITLDMQLYSIFARIIYQITCQTFDLCSSLWGKQQALCFVHSTNFDATNKLIGKFKTSNMPPPLKSDLTRTALWL